METFTRTGSKGNLFALKSFPANPRYIAIVSHGYGEHIGRYEELIEKINERGGAVYTQDHQGHGKSDGERAIIEDFESVIEDLHELQKLAIQENPGLPVVIIGHSMGGMIAARYAQLHGSELKAAVLSGPLLNGSPIIDFLLSNEEARNAPIDGSALSRDPAVGEAYVKDSLVWQGEWKVPMLESFKRELELISNGGTLACPAYWLVGGEDPLCPPSTNQVVWDTIKPADHDHKVYPGARHEIFNETNREEVFADALDFVDAKLV